MMNQKDIIPEDYIMTKTEKVRKLVAEKQYVKALQICKDWNYKDPADREDLRLGYDCYQHPLFYKSLGRDPDLQYRIAVETLKRIYS